MKLPGWRRYAMKPLTLRLTPATLATYTGVLALLALIGGAIGYAVGTHHPAPVTPPDAVSASAATVPAPDEQQIRVMNARIAELQARLMRLDALGQHLAESANLKEGEFNFDS